ncbi:MAG: hypothetical protein ABR951_02875 [Candidatus Aminicenantales bacterium]|jgi:hypothetical protein
MAEKKPDPKPEPQAAAAPESGPKRKKVNRLSLAEIEARLAECQEKQGGLVSKYARQLQDRKKALAS